MDQFTLRRCGRCRMSKPLDAFAPRTKGDWQGYCKDCHQAYKQENYRKNRGKFIARAQASNARFRELVIAAKTGDCVDCGEHYPPYVMDLDHREGETKLFNVANWNHHCRSLSRLLAEIAKCDLICANCHRERTHQRQSRKASGKVAGCRRPEVVLAAKSGACMDCHKFYPPYVLDFDHREGEIKLFNVANWHLRSGSSIEELLAEIAKCDLVCANCHRQRTYQRRRQQTATRRSR